MPPLSYASSITCRIVTINTTNTDPDHRHLVGDLEVLLDGLLEHPGGEVRRDAADVDILGEGGAAGEVGLGQELHQRLVTVQCSVVLEKVPSEGS